MRKLIAVAVAALALAAVTATTAGAQTVSKFSVQTASSHSTHHGSRLVGRLTEVGETSQSETVGFYKADFTSRTRVRVVAVFPDGKIKFKGEFRNNNRLQIVGGTRRWDGASGKVKLHNAGGGEVVFAFTVVQ
jgi:opacity protein-like surface antigen